MKAPAIGERWEARRLLALLTAACVAAAMFLVYAGTALAEHIPSTGSVPSHCVKFDYGHDALGTTKSPTDYPDVDITLVSWNDTPEDPHSVTFTIAGLAEGQYVDINLKSGSNDEDGGPYGNGTHTAGNSFQQGISHITLCVFEEEPEPTTTTTEATTTTTEATTTTTEATTTTTEATTTTVEDTTTTTVEDTTTTTVEDTTTTTIEDEVLPTVVTTVPDEVDDEELPFTGIDSDVMLGLAVVLLGGGALLLLMTRRLEEN
jgi:hypothetical protein